MTEQTDGELAAAYLSGDTAALEKLIQRYYKPLYNFLFQMVRNSKEAEDLTQETFVKIWRKFKTFHLDKRFKVWAYSIAKNTALDFLRKRKIELYSPLAEDDEAGVSLAGTIKDTAVPLLEKLQLQEICAEVQKAVGELPAIYRSVLSLYYTDELNFREISEITGESINTVKSRHLRALKLLKEILSESEIKPKLHQKID